MSTLHDIYDQNITGYPSLLRLMYKINDGLKRDGILAPNNQSLSNTDILYGLIGRPLDTIPTVHIGGTNGKGSTCFKLAKALTSSGLRTGLFVSPHLSSYRERIQVDGELIHEEALVDLAPQLFAKCIELNIPATMFEITFLVAGMYYERMGCDVVVLEVGLGGELDATNVILPCLSIVCSISLDHTRVLGNTVEAIATQKAGIFKSVAASLVGNDVPLLTMQAVAASRGVELNCVDDILEENGLAGWMASACDDTDIRNARISLAGLCLLQRRGGVFTALDLHDSSSSLYSALLCRPPCRWEKRVVSVPTPLPSIGSASSDECIASVGVECVLDVGHNPAAIAALTQRIATEYSHRPIRVVYAVSRDKDIRSCLISLLTVVPKDRIYFAEVLRTSPNVFFLLSLC